MSVFQPLAEVQADLAAIILCAPGIVTTAASACGAGLGTRGASPTRPSTSLDERLSGPVNDESSMKSANLLFPEGPGVTDCSGKTLYAVTFP